jgi:Spy/CpxP family protein refolding chaperone
MRWINAALVLVLASRPAWAQEEHHVDPIELHTFPPELVMQHQLAIGLSEEQGERIKRELQTAQSTFTDLQWDLEREMETFVSLLAQDAVDEKHALATLEKVLTLESGIKRAHLILAIRIKNVLNAEQEERLRDVAWPHLPSPEHERRPADPDLHR